MATKAKSAKGIKFGVYLNGTDAAPVFFEQVKDVPAIGESPEKIDVTDLESDAHQYIKDIPDFSNDLSFTLYASAYVTGGASNASNLNITEAMDKNESYTFIVLYPMLNQQVTLVGDWSWEMGAGAVSTAMEITFTIIPRNAPIFSDYGVNSYTLSFNPVSDSGEGTGTMASQTVAVGTKVRDLTCTFTPPANKVFGTWNTQADGLGTSYDQHDSITMDSNVTLYAIWVTDNSA